MSRWLRLYDEVLDDPKVQGLPAEDFRGWVNLLCLAARNGGRLPAMQHIAFALRMTEIGAGSLVDRLEIAGLIDRLKGGANGWCFAPHEWDKRQYKSDTSTERVKRFRQRQAETPPDTEAETDTEAEKKEHARGRASSFSEFWSIYPHKVGKDAAQKAFERALKRNDGPTLEQLMAGLQTYVAKTDDRPWCNPATWLNQGRWADAPAMPLFGNGSYGTGPPRPDPIAEARRRREAREAAHGNSTRN